MKKPTFRTIFTLALLLVFALSACSPAAPSPTPTNTPPTNTPEPTEGPPLSEGSYTTTITKEDFKEFDIPDDQICEPIGTFTLTLQGNVWYMEQTPAEGCTVKDSWSYGTWERSGKNWIKFHDDFGGGCQNEYSYIWSFDGSQLSLKNANDSCSGREIILGSHPWVKQATASIIPEKFQNLELWEDATDNTIGKTAGWTNMAELADLNKDGLVDILFANGGKFNIPGTPELSQVFLNQGAGNMFREVTEAVLGPDKMLADVIKVRDVNGDGNPDIMVGTTFQQQSRLYLGDGSGGFTNVTETHLPQVKASVGDMEFGDVDGDGDLDLALTDNGPDNLMFNSGGRTMLWLNDGAGKFVEATQERMPDIMVRLGFDVGFVDVDNDYDLDMLVMCYTCENNYLFENDGAGTFTDVTSGRLPVIFTVRWSGEGKNFTTIDYAFEAMDLNGDGYLDLATVNDEIFTRGRIFINNQQGGFEDDTDSLWPTSENIKGWGPYSPSIVFLDYDSDGDADFIIGTSMNPGRLLVNDGSGKLTVSLKVFAGGSINTAHYAVVSDLDGDKKLDVVMALSSPDYESPRYPERVFLAKNIAPDTAPPVIGLVEQVAPATGQPILIRARVHDNKSPTMPHDWQSVTLKWSAGDQVGEVAMQWYGEYLWRAAIEAVPAGPLSYQVCAVDAAGNQACSEMVDVEVK